MSKPRLHLCVSMSDELNFDVRVLRYEAYPAYIGDNGHVCTAGYSHYEELRDFRITAWCEAGRDGIRYWRTLYKDADLTLAEMETAVKILRKVQRSVEGVTSQFGYPRDVAAYTAYVAAGLGITGERPFLRTPERGKLTPSGNAYWSMSTDTLSSWVRDEHQAWLKKHGFASNTEGET